MKQKIFIVIIIILMLSVGIFYFLTKNNYKSVEFGNTTNKSAEEIKEYILNLKSYEAEISVEVTSNKNQNQYKIKQKFMTPNIIKQEVMEPNSIKGLVTVYDGNNLRIENTNLNLSKIYENYPYLAENDLCLSDFIQNYKQDQNAKMKEEKEQIILETKVQKQNQKTITKNLTIDKTTGKPKELKVQDMNGKMLVYILYNEIKINSMNKDEVLAFKLKNQIQDI